MLARAVMEVVSAPVPVVASIAAAITFNEVVSADDAPVTSMKVTEVALLSAALADDNSFADVDSVLLKVAAAVLNSIAAAASAFDDDSVAAEADVSCAVALAVIAVKSTPAAAVVSMLDTASAAADPNAATEDVTSKPFAASGVPSAPQITTFLPDTVETWTPETVTTYSPNVP